MKALRHALAAGVLVAAFGCTRSGSAEKQAYDGASTRSYLLLVGQVRSQMNSDNKERIPALICGVDTAMLDNQASRLGVLKQSLSNFATAGVDPDAVQFAQSVGGIIDLYQAACRDSAEMYREIAHQDSSLPGQKPRMPAIRAAMRGAPQADTLGALSALADTMDRAGSSSNPGYMSSAGLVQKLRDDHDRLVAAKDSHHALTGKVRADFTQRYPGQDWNAKEILP
jgi:hypothetical protein